MKAGIYGVLAVMCLILGSCGAQDNIHEQAAGQNAARSTEQGTDPELEDMEPGTALGEEMDMWWKRTDARIFDDGLIDVELVCNCDYFLWDEEMGRISLICPYDEIHLLSEGYGELERAMDVLNEENADYVGAIYETGKAITERNLEFANDAMLPFSYSREIVIMRSDEAIVSLEMEDYEWTGGFHPNYYFRGVNIDPSTGQRLRLADVVTDYERMYELVLEQLASEEYMDQDGKSYLTQGYEEIVREQFFPQWPDTEQIKWWMDTEGITVSFDAYELAGYVEGNQVLSFSFEELGELVRFPYACHGKAGSR